MSHSYITSCHIIVEFYDGVYAFNMQIKSSNRLSGRQTDTHLDRHTDIHTHTHTETQTHIYIQTDRYR